MKQETITLAELRQTELYRNVREKLMKQEPVAWAIKSDGDFTEIGFGDDYLEEVEQTYVMEGWKYEVVQLYTEPQYMELSDEEIMDMSGGENLSEQVFFWNKDAVLNFARAILKKASEK